MLQTLFQQPLELNVSCASLQKTEKLALFDLRGVSGLPQPRRRVLCCQHVCVCTRVCIRVCVRFWTWLITLVFVSGVRVRHQLPGDRGRPGRARRRLLHAPRSR